MDSSNRWLIVVLGLGILIIVGGGSWFYVAQKHSLQHSAERSLRSIAKLKVDQILQWRAERLADAAVIMKSPFFAQAVGRWLNKPDEGSTARLLAKFRSLKEYYRYANLLLSDTKGTIRLSLDGHVGPLPEEPRRALTKAIELGKPIITDLHQGPANLPVHSDVAAPILAPDGKQYIGGIILQIYAQSFLDKLIGSWPTARRSAETLLVRKDGDSVLFLNELRHQKGTALKLRIPLTNRTLPAVMAVKGIEGSVEGIDYRGKPVLAVLTPVPGSQWFMVTKVDKDEALAIWDSRASLIVATLVALMVAFLAAGGMLYQRNITAGYKRLYQAEALLRKSEERHRVTLLSVGDGIIVTDADGRVELVNPVAERLMGYSLEEAKGKPLDEVFRLVDERTRETTVSPVSRVLQEGTVIGLANHTILISSDGSEFPIADSGAPISDEKGRIVGVVLVFRDQTEERAAERLLVLEKEKAQQYLDIANIILIALDRNGAVILVNKKGCEILGRDEQDIIGKVWLEEFVPEESAALVDEAFDKILSGLPDAPEYFENWVRCASGESRLIAWRNSAFRDSEGVIVGTLSSGEDITDRRKSEKALRESEERYRATFNNASAGMNLVDRNGRYVEVNAPLADFFGYSKEELCEKSVYETTYPNDSEISRERLEALMRGELDSYRLEKRYIRKDGAVVWADLSVSSIHNPDGTFRATVGVVVDITQRKESEAALRLVAAAVDQAAESIVMTDVEGTIVYVNPAFERTTGYSREEVLGKKPSILKSGRHDSRFYEELWRTIRSGKPWKGQLINRKKDGALFYEDVTISAVKNQSGQVNYVAVKRDVTQELFLEKQLKHAQRMESIAALAGGIAHDFNNLLTITSGYTDLLLLGKEESEPGYEELQAIQHATKRGADLVKRILTFSRQADSSPRLLDLNREIRHAEKLLARTLPKMIDIRLDLAEDLKSVSADPAQMEQIILNLAVNARDAMPEGGELALRTRNAYLDEDYCRFHVGATPGLHAMLEVSDTGHGMNSETIQRIFEPFYSTKSPGQGTGLGLAMVYGIVKQHGGHIMCYSEESIGTSFKIYFRALEGAHIAEPETERADLVKGTETVLLVDDEEPIRDLGSRILSKGGYTVITACNGVEAIEIYGKRRHEISLIVLDVIMPEMGGAQCLQGLLKIDPEVRVTIASGFELRGETKRLMESTVRGFIQKPFNVRDMLVAVREALD